MKWLEGYNGRGESVCGYGVSCNIETQYSLEDWNLFDGIPSWRDVALGSVSERMARMTDPTLRQALKDGDDNIRARKAAHPENPISGAFYLAIKAKVIAPGKSGGHSRIEGYTMGEIAQRNGQHPVDTMLDRFAAENQTVFQRTPLVAQMSAMQEVINRPCIVPGLSDGGAPYQILDHWTISNGFHWSTGKGQSSHGA